MARTPRRTMSRATPWSSIRPSPPPRNSGSRRAVMSRTASAATGEVGNATDRGGEVVAPGQCDDPQVVRFRPVEAGALHHQDMLGAQQLEHESLVVLDGIHLRVQPGEDVERSLGHRAADPGDGREGPDGSI